MGRALLIIALAAVALTACRPDPRSATPPAADTPANPTEPASAPASATGS